MNGPIDHGDGGRPIERQCTGHVRLPDGTSRRCRRSANRGTNVCAAHGGSAPQVRAAAARRLAEAEVMAAGERFVVVGDGPVDVLRELERLVARVTAYADFATARIEALTVEQWAAFSPRTAAEVDLFRSALRDAGRLLTELARLGLVEHQLAERRAAEERDLHERLGMLLVRFTRDLVQDLGHSPHDQATRAIVARRLQQFRDGGGD